MARLVADSPAPESIPNSLREAIDEGANLIVVTGHRRESFGSKFESICNALKTITENNPQVHIAYPVHLNPKVQEPVFRMLGDVPRIHLLEPLAYPDFVWLLARSYFVLSDSGGIQEEVPSLNKPVLVMRNVTERPEGLEAGCAKLVGVSENEIVSEVNLLLADTDLYARMSLAENPYGDGKASHRIADVISELPTKI